MSEIKKLVIKEFEPYLTGEQELLLNAVLKSENEELIAEIKNAVNSKMRELTQELSDLELKECNHCGKVVETIDNMHELDCGDYICEKCIDTGVYKKCDICGLWHTKDEMAGSVCRGCYEPETHQPINDNINTLSDSERNPSLRGQK